MSLDIRTWLPVSMILAALCTVLILADVYLTNQHNAQIDFFASALRMESVVEIVSVGGQTFKVAMGNVDQSGLSPREQAAILRLVYEKAVARRNPLIALPGVDPANMLAAVGDLRETAQQLARTQTHVRDHVLVQTALYPLNFLTAAARLEEARLAFLDSGSARDHHTYEIALKEAIRAYRKDIVKFRTAFERAVPEDVGMYATQKSIVSRDGVLRALQILDGGMTQTQVAIAKRSSCFRGDIAACERTDIALPVFAVLEQDMYENEALRLAEDVRDILSESGYALDPLSDPLVELRESSCFVAQPDTSLFFTYQMKTSLGERFASPIFAGDIDLIPTEMYANTPFYAYFSERNFPYVPQGSLAYYVCEGSDRDLGELGAIRNIRSFALEQQLSAYAVGTNKQLLAHFETVAREGPVITYSDVVDYLGAAQSLVAEDTLPATTSNQIISLSLQLRNRSVGLHQTILSMNLFERNNLELSDQGVPLPVSIAYLFFARSGFAQLFMAGNPSATGEYGNLFAEARTPENQSPFVYYSSLDKTADTRATLVRSMSFYRSLHDTESR